MATNTKPDPSDGLPAMEAQEWAEQKHDYLRRYLHISFAARRKFINAGGKATYTELFSGPGRLYKKASGDFIDGSPLVAYKESLRTNTGFTAINLADERAEFCKAVEARLRTVNPAVNVTTHPLKSEAAAKRIVRSLDNRGINVAFVDPFNLGALPFTIIQTFATLKKIDLIIHVSAMDLMRQLPAAIGGRATSLDAFAPDWRKTVGSLPAGEQARGKYIEHWLGLSNGLGLEAAVNWRLITSSTNSPLYWLVLVARHELAAKFWDESGKAAQGDLFGKS